MAEFTTNSTANVSTGKGVKGGYIFAASVGTELPTSVVTKASELDAAFKCLGFLNEDGYVESLETDSEDIPDINGDLIATAVTSRVESAQVTFAEIKKSTLQAQYGEANVTDENGVITVKHNGDSVTTWSYVMLLKLKDDRNWTKVVPMGQSADLDDLTVAVGELCARALTIKYLTDEDGQTCYDYYDSTETEAV